MPPGRIASMADYHQSDPISASAAWTRRLLILALSEQVFKTSLHTLPVVMAMSTISLSR
jgi:hypothetical protein